MSVGIGFVCFTHWVTPSIAFRHTKDVVANLTVLGTTNQVTAILRLI